LRTNAVCYYRTSSQTNVGEDKDSLSRQKRACSNYAKCNGFQIAQEFYDDGTKGKEPILERDGFRRLLSACQELSINVILVESASRFSRDLVVQEMGYRLLVEMGFTLIAVDNPTTFVEDSPTSTMVRQILGSVSQYQKDELVTKLRVARERKRNLNKASGVLTLNGQGKCEGRKSTQETNPELIDLVKKLRRKSRKTHKRLSYRQVSARLSELGHFNGKGKPFHPQQIKAITQM